MAASMHGTDHRTLALVDALAAFWLVCWLVLGVLTAVQVWSLSGLSETAVISARAADQAGQALQRLGEIPLVGDEPGELGSEVRQAAAEIEVTAQRTRQDVRRLAVLLGVAIFLIPSSPVLGFYLPLRMRRRQQVAALRRQLDGAGRNAALEAYLAHSALANLPYAELLEVSSDPARDVREGRHADLAAAELARLGVRTSAGR